VGLGRREACRSQPVGCREVGKFVSQARHRKYRTLREARPLVYLGAAALIIGSPAVPASATSAVTVATLTAVRSTPSEHPVSIGVQTAVGLRGMFRPKRVEIRPKRVVPSVSRVVEPGRMGTISYNEWYASKYMATNYGWDATQFRCLSNIWMRESGWSQYAHNWSSGALGIPQAQPGSKMASAGANWQTDPQVQIRWGLNYINSSYGSPCNAWSFWQNHNWY
jgi:hypothetical protein